MSQGQHVSPLILRAPLQTGTTVGCAGMFLERINSWFDLPVACPAWQQKAQLGFACGPARSWRFTAGSPKCHISKAVLAPAPDPRHLWRAAALSGALRQGFAQLSSELPQEVVCPEKIMLGEKKRNGHLWFILRSRISSLIPWSGMVGKVSVPELNS